jgi:peroxiredoxin Q/BCP
MAGPTVGDQAPDFTLAGVQNGERREYSLSEFRGQPVVLAFYPGDNTAVCTRQLNSYNDDIASFGEVNAQVLALSPQSVDSHVGFAEKQNGFAFPLLADTEKEVAAAFGTLGPLKFYRRSVFVIDGDGKIVYAHRASVGLTFKPTSELVAAVKAAG